MKRDAWILIDDSQTIEEIQKQFNGVYSFLKIEFFPGAGKQGMTKSKMYDSADKKITAIQKIHHSGKISIAGNRTVRELENEFENQFGLSAQVFRKSGNVWLETTSTDDWTLDEQSEEGKSMETQVHSENENSDDHDIW